MDVKEKKIVEEENLVMFPASKNYEYVRNLKEELDDPIEELMGEFAFFDEDEVEKPSNQQEKKPVAGQQSCLEVKDADQLFEAISETQTRIDYFLKELLDNLD